MIWAAPDGFKACGEKLQKSLHLTVLVSVTPISRVVCMSAFPLRGLIVAVTIAVAGCGTESPEEHLNNARLALQKNDLKTAEIELKSVLQAAPGNAEARLLLAQTLQDKGSWADSEKELRKAQEQGASPERTLPMLARALVKQGKFQDAADLQLPTSGMASLAVADVQAERALAYLALDKVPDATHSIAEGERALTASGNPLSVSGSLRLAKARLALADRKLDEALAILNDILAQDPRFIEALYLKAQLLSTQGRLEEALKVYGQILAAKPNEIMAHLAIVEIKLHANDLAAAEKSLKAAEAIDANTLLVKHTRAKISFLKGELKQANEALQQVLRVASDHLPSVLLDAEISYGLGNYEQSLKSASKVLAQVANQPQAARLVAANELRKGNHKAAIETLTPLLKANPDDMRTLSLLGDAHFKAKQYEKAMEYLEHAANLQPKNPSFKERQAHVNLAQGKTDQALRDLEQAVSLTERAGQADLTLIMLHLRRKAYDNALLAIAAMEKKLADNPLTNNLRGVALQGKGDNASARKAFEKALSLKADFFPAAANLARMDLADKKPDEARNRYQAVLKADENNVQAMMALAYLAAADNKEQESLALMERAAKANPTAIAPRAGLVRYHLAKKKATQKALAIAHEAVNANPDSAEAYSLLGSAQMAAGDKQGALSSFTKVTEKAVNSAEAFYRLGAAQLAVGRVTDGRTSFEKALTIDPGHVGALDGLMLLDVTENNYERALRRARDFQANNANPIVGLLRESEVLEKQGKFADAAKTYEQVLRLNNDLGVFSRAHVALIRSGNQKLADQRLMDRLAKFPKDRRLQTFAAEYFMSVGRDADAIRQYEALNMGRPNDPVVMNNLAVLYHRAKNPRAESIAEQAYKLAPENPATLDTLGWILVEKGQAARAVNLLKRALDKAPAADTVRYHYAVALANSGNRQQAKKELQALLGSKRTFRDIEAARTLLEKL